MKDNHNPARTKSRVRNLIEVKLSGILHYFGVGLAAISIVFVVMGAVHLLREIPHFSESMAEEGIQLALQELLSDILLLVVGVELAIMLVRRTPESLVEVIFFVIARKMLIKTDEFYEILMGVVTIAILFAVRKYLIEKERSAEFE